MFKKLTSTLVYLYAAIISLLLALTLHFSTDSELDIARHDTYIVASKFHLLSIYVILFLLFALISWAFSAVRRPLLKPLTWITFLLILPGMLAIAFSGLAVADAPQRYYDHSVYEEFDKVQESFDVNILCAILIALFPVAVLVFISSIITAIAGKRK